MEPETLYHLSIGLYVLMCLPMVVYLWLDWPKRSMDKLHRGEIGLAREVAERRGQGWK